MNKQIRAWYMKQYPGDDLGADIRQGVTWKKLYTWLLHGENIYYLIGVSDSIIRERLFKHLAELKGTGYDFIYRLWSKSEY